MRFFGILVPADAPRFKGAAGGRGFAWCGTHRLIRILGLRCAALQAGSNAERLILSAHRQSPSSSAICAAAVISIEENRVTAARRLEPPATADPAPRAGKQNAGSIRLRGRLDPDGAQPAVALDLEVDRDRGTDHQLLQAGPLQHGGVAKDGPAIFKLDEAETAVRQPVRNFPVEIDQVILIQLFWRVATRLSNYLLSRSIGFRRKSRPAPIEFLHCCIRPLPRT
jgi:hypothetical protein